MAKKVVHYLFPDMHKLRDHPQLRSIFGNLMRRQNLWHINRHSVSRAIAIGFFCAFIPLPIQMVLAALFAIPLRANLPVSVITVWISNPVTITPMFYFCYELGAVLLGVNSGFAFEFTWAWLKNGFFSVWQPLLLGCVITASTTAAIGYFSVRLYWRYYVISYWRRRSRFDKK